MFVGLTLRLHMRGPPSRFLPHSGRVGFRHGLKRAVPSYIVFMEVLCDDPILEERQYLMVFLWFFHDICRVLKLISII